MSIRSQENLGRKRIISISWKVLDRHIELSWKLNVRLAENLHKNSKTCLFIWRNVAIKLCVTKKIWMAHINVLVAANKCNKKVKRWRDNYSHISHAENRQNSPNCRSYKSPTFFERWWSISQNYDLFTLTVIPKSKWIDDLNL